jgi:FkbM family methyltransferase
MSEQPFVAKWRTSALKRIRRVEAYCGRKHLTCRYFGARFAVDLDDLIGYDIAVNRLDYRNLARFLAECRRRHPSVFVDVGANIGTYTCAVGISGVPAIVAFEPWPQLFRELQHNVGLNGLAAELHPVAAGDREGIVRLTSPQGRNRGLAHVSDDGELSIPMTTLDKMLPQRNGVIAIKLDVEGFEARVLDGAREFLGHNGGYAQIEARYEADIDAVTTRMLALRWRKAGAHGLDVMFER